MVPIGLTLVANLTFSESELNVNAGELFQAGRLGEAIAAAIQDIKNQPGDLPLRTLLFSLLCFDGDLDRARKQLDVVGNQAALSEAPAYSNMLAAEQARRRVFAEGLRPKFLVDPPPRLEKYIEAIGLVQARKYGHAKNLLDAAEDERVETPGMLNDTPFDDFADADDMTRCVFEFQQGQDYYWVPIEQMAHLQVVVPSPVRPRDLYSAPCQVILKNGMTQRGFTPVLYVDSYRESDPNLKLGHGTEFHDIGGGVYRGTGRKQFVAGEADPTPMDLTDVTFS
jgi:type VI secretion system protein ImpE